MKSKEWIDRQKRDFFVKKAKKSGYVSRAAFKLLEIDKKFNLISKAENILEFGSAPGGWSQAVFEINKKVKMHAFDLLDMKFNHPNLNFLKEDFINFDYSQFYKKFDLIISDIAPNTIGHKSTDHLRIISMIEDIIVILDEISLPQSSFICKIWKGSEESNIIKLLKLRYEYVNYYKPKSTRNESSEIFIVANKFMK